MASLTQHSVCSGISCHVSCEIDSGAHDRGQQQGPSAFVKAQERHKYSFAWLAPLISVRRCSALPPTAAPRRKCSRRMAGVRPADVVFPTGRTAVVTMGEPFAVTSAVGHKRFLRVHQRRLDIGGFVCTKSAAAAYDVVCRLLSACVVSAGHWENKIAATEE
jgi:hypothetical protein